MENKSKGAQGEGIEEIVRSLNANPDSVSESESADGVMEFDFEAAENGAAVTDSAPRLVFEYVPLEFVAEEMPEEVRKIAEAEAEANKKAQEEAERAAKEARDKEFAAAKIWTTYVPRFTEVSQTYRMKDDPRPRRDKDGRLIVPDAAKVEDARAAEPAAPAEELDPTAEMDEKIDNAVIVERSRPEPEEGVDTLNMYKFSDGEEEKPEVRERTVEDERADIDKLFVRPLENSEDKADKKEPFSSEEEFAEKRQAEPVEKENYDIPDPDAELRVKDYPDEEEEFEVPDGIAPPVEGKRNSGEFNLPIQRDGFKDRFLDSLMSIRIRLVTAAFFSLLLLVFEALCAFGVFTSNIFGIPVTPVARGLIDLMFASCSFLIALPEVIRSFRHLGARKLSTELIVPVAFAVVVGYYAVVANVGGLYTYPLYGFMFSILSLSSVLGSLYRTEADFTAFKLVSKNTEKDILEKKATRTLPEENIALDGVIDEYKSRTARIFHASFVTDFFRRTCVMLEKPSRTAILAGVSLGVAAISGLIAFFIPGGAFAAASTFTLVFLLAVPAFSILSHKISYYDAQLAALTEESAAVGEAGFDGFSDVDVIAFDDTEIFGPDDVNLKRFMLYGDRDNMDIALRQMSSLFAVAGGPLRGIFANALDNRYTYKPAGNPEIEDDGLSGDVGGKRIAAGTEEYMLRHGIAIPEGAAVTSAGIDTTKVMFAAENGEVYAKFYIRYSFSEEFTQLLPELREEGVVPLVYTRDPNISNELLRTLTAGADCMRVMKKHTPAYRDEKVHNRVSAGLVTLGGKINAINLILIAKQKKKLCDRLAVSEVYAMIAGALLAVALSVFGMTSVPTLIFGAWQIAWCIVLRIVSRANLLKGKDLSVLETRKDKSK